MFKVQVISLVTTALLATHCGDDHKKPGPVGEDVQIDTSKLAAVDQSLRSTSSEVLWTVKVTVGSEEKAKVERVDISKVQSAVNGIKFKSYDSGRIEATAYEGSRVLATNVQDVAYGEAENRSTWDSECKGVRPDFNLAESQAENKDGQSTVQINISICDFVGAFVTPTISIQSQHQDAQAKKVVYKCSVNFDYRSSSSVYTYTDALCQYGYDTLDGETAPSIEVPKTFEPSSPYYEAHRLKLDRIQIDADRSGRKFHLETDFGNPPFGSLASCSEQRVDLFYMDGSSVKQLRAIYKQAPTTDGSYIWVLQNESQLPSFDAVSEYYMNASPNSRGATIYRFCEWSPAAMAADARTSVQIQ